METGVFPAYICNRHLSCYELKLDGTSRQQLSCQILDHQAPTIVPQKRIQIHTYHIHMYASQNFDQVYCHYHHKDRALSTYLINYMQYGRHTHTHTQTEYQARIKEVDAYLTVLSLRLR